MVNNYRDWCGPVRCDGKVVSRFMRICWSMWKSYKVYSSNNNIGQSQSKERKKAILDTLSNSLFSMQYYSHGTGPACHWKYILFIQDPLFWRKKKLKNRNRQALWVQGWLIFKAPCWLLTREGLKVRWEKLTPLLERRKKKC